MQRFEPLRRIHGELTLSGDKSISHRAVMVAALAKGRSYLHNLSLGADVAATLSLFSQLGVESRIQGNLMIVDGLGFKGLKKPFMDLDAKNSGTTARLTAGILVHQNFSCTIIGDESLTQRPMKRISDPLRSMGADIQLSPNGTLPMTINPSNDLHRIEYIMPVASAQVKSSVLLSGLFIDGVTRVIENIPTRNHTEHILELPTTGTRPNIIFSSSASYPVDRKYEIPGDISSAAFYIVLTLLLPDSELILRNILLNPTRTGYLSILREMGADIAEFNLRINYGETIGHLRVRSSKLKNIMISAEAIPNIIDEIPILSVAGLFADGEFQLNHAEELRTKESDRIKALCDNYRLLGCDVEETSGGFTLSKSEKKFIDQPVFQSFNDHRIAMAFAVLSMLLKNGGSVDSIGSIAISNPHFIDDIKTIGSF